MEVCFLMKSSSASPSTRMTLIIPRNNAASVPGTMGTHSSDLPAVVEK